MISTGSKNGSTQPIPVKLLSNITPELLLQAYANGVFPMADSANSDEIFWVDPTKRGVFPLGGFHMSRSLRRALRRGDYDIRINSSFNDTVANCANREETWINAEIHDLYSQLHYLGFAHSLEVWRGKQMFGGVYGVTLGAAFFGESMFSKAANGSKIALAYLMHRLNAGGFKLFDTQFITPHLTSLGATEIKRGSYHKQLITAVTATADFETADTPTPFDLLGP